jgi:hypothetical protein
MSLGDFMADSGTSQVHLFNTSVFRPLATTTRQPRRGDND